MSYVEVLDFTATRARTIEGLKECYTVTGTAQDDGTLLAIPPSLDDTPVAALMPVGGDVSAGNAETLLHRFELQIWHNVADTNPLDTLIFLDRVLVMFRTDLDAGETTTRLLYQGYDQLRTETMNSGQTYLVLPIRFEAMQKNFMHLYAV